MKAYDFSFFVVTIFIIFSYTVLHSQTCNGINGLNVNTGNIYLASINSSNGLVTNISNNPVGQTLKNNTSTIDYTNNVLYFCSNDGITAVDINTGNIITQTQLTNSGFILATLVHNCSDSEIYGLNIQNGNIFLSNINPTTGAVVNISNSSVGQVLKNNSTTIDPVNMVLYFYSSNGITAVDLISGNIISQNPIINPNFILATLVYNCSTGVIYGLNIQSGDIYLCIIDPATGIVTNLSSSPIGQLLANNTSTIDPFNELFFFYSGDGISTVDLNTGNIISQTPIINPNFILATIQTNCSTCCIACDSNHGELLIQSIEGQND